MFVKMIRLIAAPLLIITISQCLLARELVPPFGLDMSIAGNTALLYWYYPGVNQTVIQIVDDEPQGFHFYSSSDHGARLASKFELPGYSVAIESVELKLWPSDPFPGYPGDVNSPFKLSLTSELSDQVADVPLWEMQYSNPQPGLSTWIKFPVREVCPSENVYLQFHWLAGTPAAPLPAVVYFDRFINSYEGHVEGGQLIWNEIVGEAALMRLIINSPDTNSSLAASTSLPDSFSVFIFKPPNDSISEEPTVITIRDSLHIFLNLQEHQGKFATVAAWSSDTLSRKSAIIQLDVTTDVAHVRESPSKDSHLLQNYPNPFNAETVIVSSSSETVAICDLLGRVVTRLTAAERVAGQEYHFHWQGSDAYGRRLPSGVYFYGQADGGKHQKLLLLK